MREHMLVHLNVVRPIGAFWADHPDARYIFEQLAAVFAQARADEGIFWHNHDANKAGTDAVSGLFSDTETGPVNQDYHGYS